MSSVYGNRVSSPYPWSQGARMVCFAVGQGHPGSIRPQAPPPSSPPARAASTGRSRQNSALPGELMSPRLPGRIALAPQPLEVALVAQRVHALPEALVPVRRELLLLGQALAR